jgi:lambda family phage portal protein
MRKSKLAVRIYERLFAPAKRKTVKRYAGARRTRLNADWSTSSTTANWNLRTSLAALRGRSRQMCRDVPLFKKYLRMVRTNIIGPKGLQLMCRAYLEDEKTLDAKLNKRVQAAWWKWGFAENCSITGKLDWLAAQRLFVTQLARDGEVLVQKMRADNPFGIALKFWNVDYLDETYNDTLPGGNRVIMSVEIDGNDRPVAYWLTTPASDITFTVRRERQRTRIPADQMIHAFLVLDDETQVRGVPWFHAVLLEGKNLAVYKGGVLDSCKMMAMSGGFFTKTLEDGVPPPIGEEDEDGVEKEITVDFSPASFHIAPDGYKFEQFDPKQPTQNHAEYVKLLEGEIAAGLDVPYFDLTGDLSNVNYSSARVGQADERDVWRELQDFVAGVFCREIYHSWVLSSMLTGAVTAQRTASISRSKIRCGGRAAGGTSTRKKRSRPMSKALANKLTTWTDVLGRAGHRYHRSFRDDQAGAGSRRRNTASIYRLRVKGPATETADPNADNATRTPITADQKPTQNAS